MKKLASVLCLALIMLGGHFMVPATAYADGDAFSSACNDSSLTDQQKALAGCNDVGNPEAKNQFNQALQIGTGIIIGLSGSVALVFIILGGVHYMTAHGDPTRMKKAKETIMYAAIGLIICGLAFAITNWIISILP